MQRISETIRKNILEEIIQFQDLLYNSILLNILILGIIYIYVIYY